jgi:hypothetical protein
MKGYFKMNLNRYIWIVILIAGIGAGLQAGEIYQWTDENGVQHFTDGPPPPGAQIVESLSETQSDGPPSGTGTADYGDTGKVEGDVNDPADGEDTSATDDDANALEGDEDTPNDREDYWRRLGWGEDQTGSKDNGTVEGGENRPTEGEGTGASESGDADAVDGGATGPIEGGDKRFKQW